jgi:hypothetical protein
VKRFDSLQFWRIQMCRCFRFSCFPWWLSDEIIRLLDVLENVRNIDDVDWVDWEQVE